MSASLNADDHGEWVDALCRQYPAELWFPEPKETVAAYRDARSICDECPLKAECLAWALDNRERVGMWGGLTPKERSLLRRGAAA